MKTTLLVAAIAAGIALSSSAQAREGNGQRMTLPTFEQLDINADGAITLDEVEAGMQARAEARFAAADANGDGALSAEEMLAQAQNQTSERLANRIAERIEDADTNGDGLLQAEEIAAKMEGRRAPNPERMFNRVDADNDGTVSAEEYEEARAKMEERGPRGDRGDRGDN